MSDRTPPKLATALLKRLGPRSAALSGDLLEAYQSGHSRWWYWQQMIAAVTIATRRDYERERLATASIFVTAATVMWGASQTHPLIAFRLSLGAAFRL